VRQRGTNGNDLFGMAGDLDVVRLLMERADLNRGNDYGWTKLHQAGYGNDRVAAIERLVELGADLNADPYRGTPLTWAAANGRVAAIRHLVELCADVNGRGTFGGPDHGQGVTALHLAAQSGHADAVETLLELGTDPTIRDAMHGGTPAGWAQHGCHPELVERLS